MKTVSVLLTGLFLSVSVISFGQAKPAVNPAFKKTHQELKRDIKKDKAEVKKDKVERREDIKTGDKVAAKNETKEIKATKADIRQDRKELKAMRRKAKK